MKDTVVFDIETKNTFQEVGGEQNIHLLEMSVVGAYSYNNNEYYCFDESEFDKFEELMRNTDLLVGFASKRFDTPIANKYVKMNMGAIPHYDILEEIQNSWGRRISLDLLGEANLGLKKTGHGLDAIDWYRNGEMEKLKEYCKQDVKITKEIFDLIRKQGYLWIPQRNTPEMAKAVLEYKEKESDSQTSLF